MNLSIISPYIARLTFDEPCVVASTHLFRLSGSSHGAYTIDRVYGKGLSDYIDLKVTEKFTEGELLFFSYPVYSALEDNFIDADSTLLTNHTPDSGGAWFGDTGAFSIENNYLKSTVNQKYVAYNTGLGNKTTTWWINPDHIDTSGNMRIRLCARVQDTNNYWSLDVTITGTALVKQLYLVKVEAGVDTGGATTVIQHVAQTSFDVDLDNEWVRVQCVDDGSDLYYSLPDWGYALDTTGFSAGDRAFLAGNTNVGIRTMGSAATAGPYRLGRILVE